MKKKVLAVIVIIALLLAVTATYYMLFREEPREVPPFFEEHPAWNMPDPAVMNLAIEPDRADPGDSIVLRAWVANIGPGAAGAAELTFLVNDVEIERETVGPLEPGAEVEVDATWTGEPGRHRIVAQLELGVEIFEADVYNNFQTGIVRVSGGLPEPELEVEMADLESLRLIPGESYNITMNFRNPSFADVRNIPVEFYIDGEVIGGSVIEYLAQGEQQELYLQWYDVTPGEHMIVVRMDLPDEFPYADLQSVKSWHVILSDRTVLHSQVQMDKWVSIGPRILTHGSDGLPTGSVGRVDHIAFHPTDPKVLYAGATSRLSTGGIWKTTDGGESWIPLTDKLPSLPIGAVAVDPEHPEIVYFGTGHSIYGGGFGIFKSINGGVDWDLFAANISGPALGTIDIKGVSKLIIRYPSPSQVMIYAATSIGVLRYTSNDPWAKGSLPSDWIQIKSGKVVDIAVDPNNDELVYATVAGEGLSYTLKGKTATSDADWNKLTLPQSITSSTGQWYTFDVFWGNPRIIFAALTNPKSGFTLGIYKSTWPHDSWSDVRLCKPGEHNTLYNPFVRVHPQNKDLVYFSGVKLYKRDIASNKEVLIEGIHDDMHGMEWDPHNPGKYYVAGDGGVWNCTVEAAGVSDSCQHRNNDLRVTQFYDFHASPTNSSLMIGGTQDTGTILCQGGLDWKIIRGGDGAFSLIGSGNQVLYAQHQYLNSTMRSAKGVNTWWGDWKPAWGTDPYDLPDGQPWYVENAYITVHPNDPDTVLAQGKEVYVTYDGGATWEPIGPKGSGVKEQSNVKRVVVQNQTFTLFAGTNKGQIFYRKGVTWSFADSHPESRAVINMAFAPTNHKVLYVAYSAADPYYRIQRLEMLADGSWISAGWIAHNLPTTHKIPGGKTQPLTILSIAGDGHNDNIVYVGTNQGVFRGDVNAPTYDMWKPYNDGLPLTRITDLLVDPTSKELRAATFGRGAWTAKTGP